MTDTARNHPEPAMTDTARNHPEPAMTDTARNHPEPRDGETSATVPERLTTSARTDPNHPEPGNTDFQVRETSTFGPTSDPTPRFAYGRAVPATITPGQIAAMIDHALLKPEMTPVEVRLGCEAAAALDVWSVCVKPADVQLAAQAVAETATRVCAVISFPHGNSVPSVKVAETKQALADGASEIDLVLNVGRLRAGDFEYVRDEIARVVEVGHAANCLVKVIFENAYLSEDEISLASCLAEDAGADFIKTSTGFAATGATLQDMRIMASSASPDVQLKASGGIRTLDRALEFIALGVTRLGVSASEEILTEATRRLAEFGVIKVPEQTSLTPDQATPADSADRY